MKTFFNMSIIKPMIASSGLQMSNNIKVKNAKSEGMTESKIDRRTDRQRGMEKDKHRVI